MKFVCSLNSEVVSALGPSGKIPKEGNFSKFNENWVAKNISIGDIKDAVEQGNGICAWQLVNGKRVKNDTGCIKAGLIIIDIDNQDDGKGPDGEKIQKQELNIEQALELEISQKYLSLGYFSPSSTEEWPRFRLVFALENPIVDPEFFQWFTRKISESIPGSDRRATQIVNLFYGCHPQGKNKVFYESENFIPSSKIKEAYHAYLAVPKEEKKQQDAEEFLDIPYEANGIPLDQIVSSKVRSVIDNEQVEDRSFTMAIVFKEVIGWANWLQQNNLKPNINPRELCELCFENIYEYAAELDGKFNRILYSISDGASLLPSIVMASDEGDLAAWRKIKFFHKEQYLNAAPEDVKATLALKPKPKNSVLVMESDPNQQQHQQQMKTPNSPNEVAQLNKSVADMKDDNKKFGDADIADIIVKNQGDAFLYDSDIAEFFFYDEKRGVWITQNEILIGKRVSKVMDTFMEAGLIPSYTASRVNSVVEILKRKLVRYIDNGTVSIWSSAKGSIPFQNGILNTKSMEFKEGKSPDNYLRNTLPYEYDANRECPKFKKWLSDSVGEKKVVLLQAFFRALITGYTSCEKFLHLVGPGGTGKSTLQQLLIALVGFDTTHTTSLELIETSKFETFQLMGKKLVLLTDESNFNKRMDTIKKLTSASDSLRAERKYGKEVISFKPEALLCIASNEHISSSDTTSGLERRRFTIVMDRVVPPSERKNLLSVYPDRLEGEFVHELPGIHNWALSLGFEQMRDILANPIKYCPSMNSTNIEALVLNNPIVAWLAERTLYHPDAATPLGGGAMQPTTDERERGMFVRNPFKEIYASYVQYCKECGYKAYAKNRFVEMIKETTTNVLKIPGVKVNLLRGKMSVQGILLAPSDPTSNRYTEGEHRLPSPVEFAQDQSLDCWKNAFLEHIDSFKQT